MYLYLYFFPGSSDGKESTCNAGDLGLIPFSRSSLGEGNGYPLKYSCLENAMDRGAWWARIEQAGQERVRRPCVREWTRLVGWSVGWEVCREVEWKYGLRPELHGYTWMPENNSLSKWRWCFRDINILVYGTGFGAETPRRVDHRRNPCRYPGLRQTGPQPQWISENWAGSSYQTVCHWLKAS